VVKERVVKRYRHPTLEASLSKKRLNQEARCILRSRKNGVAAPCIYHIDYEAARIYMSFIVGQTLKDWLVALPSDAEIDAKLKAVGLSIAGLHDADVVHGDLTSSNIMVRTSADVVPKLQCSVQVREFYPHVVADILRIICFVVFMVQVMQASGDTGSCSVIDFGLSYVSAMAEDKVCHILHCLALGAYLCCMCMCVHAHAPRCHRMTSMPSL